jgi:uncharacterized protein (DUF924 family)
LQERSVSLFVNLGDASSLQHALCHRDQIVRFGRFPDRNKALGRPSTKAEEEFLLLPRLSGCLTQGVEILPGWLGRGSERR